MIINYFIEIIEFCRILTIYADYLTEWDLLFIYTKGPMKTPENISWNIYKKQLQTSLPIWKWTLKLHGKCHTYYNYFPHHLAWLEFDKEDQNYSFTASLVYWSFLCECSRSSLVNNSLAAHVPLTNEAHGNPSCFLRKKRNFPADWWNKWFILWFLKYKNCQWRIIL